MEEELKKLRLHPEAPIDVSEDKPFENDYLGFKEPVERVCSIMDNIETPFTMGIYGAWGSGKTSFMKMMQAQLKKDGHKTFWFDAWQYENETSLMLPLMSKLAKELKEQEELSSEIIDKVKRSAVAVTFAGANALLKGLTHGAVGVGDIKEGFEFYEDEFVKAYDSWISKTESFKEDFEELIDKSKGDESSMAIFIDDLDRCMPENTIKLIEDIKHFLSAKGCIFVIGADKEVLSKGIEAKYGSNLISGDEYLEKIVSLSFNITRTLNANMGDFICESVKRLVEPGYYDSIKDKAEELAKIMKECDIDSNPRKLKNIIKRFLLFMCAEDRGDYDVKILGILLFMYEFYPSIYNYIKNNKHGSRGDNIQHNMDDIVKLHGETFRKEWHELKKSRKIVNVLDSMEGSQSNEGYFLMIEFLYNLSE